MRWRVILVAAVAAGIAANTIGGDFVWDDLVQIVANPWIRDPALLPEAFRTHVVGFDPSLRTSFYRPLVHVAYASVYAAFGLAPWAFHALNVLLHAATAACLLLLLEGYAESGAALVGALLFAAHPVHVEPVAWASGIYDLAMALLVLLAVLATKDQRPLVRWSAPACFALALLWKEPAVALLPIAACLAAVRREFRWREWAALGLVTACYLALRVSALGGLTGGDRNPLRVNAAEAVLSAVAIFARYLGLLLLPVGLTPLHDDAVVRTVDARFLAGLCAIALVATAAWLARRSEALVLGLALLVFPLLPALYVPALKDTLLSERYLYLPSAGAALLAAVAMARWRWLRIPAGVAVAVLAVASVSGNRVWHDNVSLWTEVTGKSPERAIAWEYLGGAYAVERRFGDAVRPLEIAVRLDPRRLDAQTNLAIALGAVGRREEARTHALDALALCPPSCAKQQEVLRWLSAPP